MIDEYRVHTHTKKQIRSTRRTAGNNSQKSAPESLHTACGVVGSAEGCFSIEWMHRMP